ncbi:RING finger protein 39-like isoform X2 [Cygnus atratus]|uniref:RING finger protein 39-like isoform X2 n=1 Tax=Cygnus atratus TaxID=8868 RepID=UPI0015D5C1B8|nr:RING finger protein 39-like isoform X2 [Cygnus atratus]
MAEGNAVRNLREEATCAVCLDFFRRPVMLLACGHNFCHACVARCAQKGGGAASCPQCRLPFPRGAFRPNRQLANVVAAVRELVAEEQDLGLPAASRAGGAHGERRAHLEDREPTPSSSAPQEHLGPPPKNPQEDEGAAAPLTPPGGGDGGQQALLARVEAERQKLLAVLGGLRGLVGQQESRLLARLGHLRRGLEEAKGRQAGGDRWDCSITPSRSTERRPRPLELEAELEDFSQKNNALAAVVERLKDVLACSLEEDLGGYQKASVTLDPATAHPQILVSPDGRSARRCKTPRDPLPGSSERFEALRCVLGRQGFAEGRHRWAVEVPPGPDWALGVAREFVPRKGCYGLSPARGVWAVGQWLGQLRALTWPSPTCLPLARVPKRIEVALDYGGGRVAFRDADSEAEIFAFPPAAFAGERLRPLLWLGEGPALLTFCP